MIGDWEIAGGFCECKAIGRNRNVHLHEAACAEGAWCRRDCQHVENAAFQGGATASIQYRVSCCLARCRPPPTLHSNVVRLIGETLLAKVSGMFFPKEGAVMHSKIIAAMLTVLAMAVMAGCNTMEGLGKDVKSVGQSLESSADKNKNKE